jgi:hypothetical protein
VKTQIIQLESHDDTISVKDKMDWSQTPRVLLVWPNDGKVLRNRLDLIILERHCSANGSRLALLTNDKKVIQQAEEIGIPVFQSRSAAQFQHWGKSNREFNRRELFKSFQQPRDHTSLKKQERIPSIILPSWAKIIIFGVAVTSVLAIGWTLLPSATVKLPVEIQRREISIPVIAIPDQSEIQISGIIPARKLVLSVEDQVSIPSSGSIEIPSEFAVGEVIFENSSDQSIFIPAETVLSTASEDLSLFITTEPGETPQGTGSQIILPIRALQPGTQGNLPANSITRINQEIGADLTVTNPGPINGGTDLTVAAPSESDYQLAMADLTGSLNELAEDKATQLLSTGDYLLSQPEIIEVLEITSKPEIGSPGNELILKSSVEYGFRYTSKQDLLELAQQTISALYSGDAFDPDFNTIFVTNLTDPTITQDKNYSWEIMISWNEYQTIDQEKIVQTIIGKTTNDAEDRLQESLKLDNKPEIVVNPSWWYRIPVLPFRIKIVEGLE